MVRLHPRGRRMWQGLADLIKWEEHVSSLPGAGMFRSMLGLLASLSGRMADDPIERLNGEIKRRTQVIGIFSNGDAHRPSRRRDPARTKR